MKLNYTWWKTKKIRDYLQRLEIAKKVIDFLPRFPYSEENLRRHSLLKSSLFSARIEGNKLQLEDVQYANEKSKDIAKLEVFNLLRALRWLYSRQCPKRLTKALILKLHQRVLKNISPAGHFRKEPSAIFNQAGIAVYVAPSPEDVPKLIKALIKKTNQSQDPGPIKAAVFHFGLEKIHPFLDGNGRVGRLLSTFILKQSAFGFRGLVSQDVSLDKNRQKYYDFLSITKKDITLFVEFFLKTIVIQAEKTIEDLKNIKAEFPEDKLLPRRKEILNIIRDHQTLSFNFLKRRFLKVSESTLHYDLSQLIKEGFIQKLGSTRGVLYSPK